MRQIKKYIPTIIIFCLLLVSQNTKAAVGNNKAMPWIYLLLLDNGVTITISGKATIPNYTPAGSLALLVDGLDGSIYGAGSSDPDGNFSIKASIPKATRRVLVYAVDPDNPEFHVKAYVDLDESSDESKRLSGSLGTRISYESRTSIPKDVTTTLDARSLAESIVSDYSARQKSDFSQEQWDAVSTITNALRDGTYNHKLCSSEQNPQINALLKTLAQKAHFLPDIRLKIGSFVRGQGDLITRLRRAQEYVTDSVTSSNYMTERGAHFVSGIGGLVIIYLGCPVLGAGVTIASAVREIYQDIEVMVTRNTIEKFDIPSLRGFTTGWVSRLDLELAATIIVDQSGYGNCQEKGIVGAYIASRFNEFKQVAHVVSETDRYDIHDGDFAAHSFAIACTEDESKYDISRLLVAFPVDGWVNPPEEFFSAGCYLVDPWAGKVELITEEVVVSERWHDIKHVMKVDLTGQNSQLNAPPAAQQQHQVNTNFKESSFPETARTCPVNFSCSTCLSKSELIDSVCQPFIPSAGCKNTPPEAHSQSVSLKENTSETITLSGSDADNDPLTYTIIDQPDHGALSGTAPNLTYTPTAGYIGSDSFTFIVNDGKSDSPIAVVNINVSPAPKEYVVYTIDNWNCFEARIVTVGERSRIQKDELLCNYHYYADNTCTVEAKKTEMQGGFATRAAGYEWLETIKGEWMLNRWCPGNGYYKLKGKPGYYMIF